MTRKETQPSRKRLEVSSLLEREKARVDLTGTWGVVRRHTPSAKEGCDPIGVFSFLKDRIGAWAERKSVGLGGGQGIDRTGGGLADRVEKNSETC